MNLNSKQLTDGINVVAARLKFCLDPHIRNFDAFAPLRSRGGNVLEQAQCGAFAKNFIEVSVSSMNDRGFEALGIRLRWFVSPRRNFNPGSRHNMST